MIARIFQVSCFWVMRKQMPCTLLKGIRRSASWMGVSGAVSTRKGYTWGGQYVLKIRAFHLFSTNSNPAFKVGPFHPILSLFPDVPRIKSFSMWMQYFQNETQLISIIDKCRLLLLAAVFPVPSIEHSTDILCPMVKVFLQSFSIHIQMFFMPPDWLPESGLCLDWQGCGDWESLWHRRSLKETVQPPKQEVGSEVSTESYEVAPSAPPFGRSWARAEPVMVLSCEKDRQTPGCPITPSCWHVLGCLSGRNVRIGPANRDGLDSRYPEDWAWIKY